MLLPPACPRATTLRIWPNGLASTVKRPSASSPHRPIDPTNHLAEQATGFVVIDRHIRQRTRSEKGRRWCERIWTPVATCAQQVGEVFEFLLDSVEAYLSGTSAPSLLPSGP